MQLLRDLGPAKAGSFAFVSPIIAVLVGVIAAGETVSPLSIAGMAVMLVAAGACLYSDVLEALLARIAATQVVRNRKLVVQHSDEISWRRRPWLSRNDRRSLKGVSSAHKAVLQAQRCRFWSI